MCKRIKEKRCSQTVHKLLEKCLHSYFQPATSYLYKIGVIFRRFPLIISGQAALSFTELQTMKKAKRVLALILAFVMISSVFMTESFAKTANENYNAFKTDPTSFFNGVDKIEFTAGQGIAYILDMLDVMLKGVDIYETIDIKVGSITLDMRTIDEAFYTIYNLVKGIDDGDYLKNLGLNGFMSWVSGAAKFGDFEELTVTSIADPNNMANARLRGVPQVHGYTGARTTAVNDLDVLKQLTGFLADNRGVLS